MAVSENDLVVGPLTPAAGVTTISLDFYFEQASWLEVYKSGSETPLVLNTDYTVTGAGSISGVVTLTTAANGTDAYSIYLVVPLERSSDMQLRGEFKSKPFNVELDRVWQAMQGIDTRLGRTLRVSRTSNVPTPLFSDTAAERSDRVLKFSGDGSGLEVGPTETQVENAQGYANEAEDAADRAEAAAPYRTRTEAITDTIPGTVERIRTHAFFSTGDGGGAEYRRVAAGDIAGYPAEAWFASQDGAYWLLDEDRPTPAMTGGHRHATIAEMTHAGAVDSTAAIDAIRAYAAKRGVPYSIDAFYKYIGSYIFADNETMLGVGRLSCGIQTWLNNTEAGAQVLGDNVTIVDVGFYPYLYEAKIPGGGTGMIGCGLIVGNYSDGTIPTPQNYYINNVTIGRKPNEPGIASYNAYGFHLSGGSAAGYVGAVYLKDRHSGGYSSHWTGNTPTPFGPMTETVHPRNFTIEKLVMEGNIGIAATLSSVGGVRIGSVVVEQCDTLLAYLSGDETDYFNVGQPNVGAGNWIGNLICNRLSGSSHGVTVTSLGTSKFRTSDGQSKPYKDQLRSGLTIDNLVMHAEVQVDKVYGVDAFLHYGEFKINSARITGFVDAARIRNCQDDVSIHYEFTDGRTTVQNSTARITGHSDRGDPVGPILPGEDIDEACNVRVISDEWSVAASNINRLDDTIMVPTRLGGDVFKGCTFELTGTTSYGVETLRYTADAFTESQPYTRVNLGYALSQDLTNAVMSAGSSVNRAILDAKIGDTYLVAVDGILSDISPGDVITITEDKDEPSETVTALPAVTASTESDTNTPIKLGFALPHAMTGVTFKFIGDSKVEVNATCMKGARSGIYATGGKTKVRGGVQAGRFNVLFGGANTQIDYRIETPVSGLSRTGNEAYSIYDLFGIGGGSAVVSGNLGAGKASASGAYYSIGATSAPPANIFIRDAIVHDPVKVVAQPDNEVILSVSNSHLITGVEYTEFDYLGLARAGQDTNGSFVRHADGSMECWVRNTDIGPTRPYTWTFPGGGFIETDSVFVSCEPGSPTVARMGHGYANSATTAQVWVNNADGSLAPSTGANLYAKGWWKLP